LNLSFRFFEITKSQAAEAAMISAWSQSGLSKMTYGFVATAADYATHIGFFGAEHMVLRLNYFKNPLKNSEDAFASKCPKRNKCYTVFLEFDRLADEKSNSPAAENLKQ
jgi:hypothetical protein